MFIKHTLVLNNFVILPFEWYLSGWFPFEINAFIIINLSIYFTGDKYFGVLLWPHEAVPTATKETATSHYQQKRKEDGMRIKRPLECGL